MVTPVSYTSGDAGSGKTHKFRELIRKDPTYGVLTATTGIGAVTINGQTIHSLLSYSDLDDLRRVMRHGGFFSRLKKLVTEGELWPGCNIIIDEHSMLNAEQLDATYEGVDSLNNWIENGMDPEADCEKCGGSGEWRGDFSDACGPCRYCDGTGVVGGNKHDSLDPVGLSLVGDFAQLPPVEGQFAFHANCWPKFEANHEHLTTQYRQNDPAFLDALNFLRRGKGPDAVEALRRTAVEFALFGDPEFPGVTVFGTNKDVANYNAFKYSQLTGQEFITSPKRQGEQKKDWLKEDVVPRELKLKIGARVMVLANDVGGSFLYSNGDLGTLRDVLYAPGTKEIAAFTVDLDRLKVKTMACTRCMGDGVVSSGDDSDHERMCQKCAGSGRLPVPSVVTIPRITREYIDPNYHGPKWQARELGKIIGSVSFFPLKLAYALTVHKTQGLSLDKVQFNISHPFTGSPAMCYVAISRVRTPEGLRIIGTPDMLRGRIAAHPEVSRWL